MQTETTINIADLETINILIAGHIDHGKTTLLQRLSGKWTDTHSEELKRGITIKLGYADTIIYNDPSTGYNREGKGKPVRYVSFVDAPGHEMLMATMLSGAAIVDAAILVIAANEGIKPQTREHLMALQAKKIDNVIIIQNKIDLVPVEKAKENFTIIKQFLSGTPYENSQVIPVSAQQGVNINKVYEAICNIQIPERNANELPIFLVARSFDINKPGTTINNLHGSVLGGTLKSGQLKIGDIIEIKPGLTIKEANQIHYKTVKTKIRSLFKGSHQVEILTPGGSSAIETELDMSVGKTDSLSGCVVSLKDKLPDITSELRLRYNLFSEITGSSQKTKVDPLKTTEVLMLSANTSVTVGSIKKLTNNEAEISLRIPIVPFHGEKVGIARNMQNHWRLIGYGEII